MTAVPRPPRTIERFLRRGVRCPHNGAGFGTAAPRDSYLQSASVALADVAESCSELPFHRHHLAKSSPSHVHYATEGTHRLMWFNFAHLFSVSRLPLSTAWMAASQLAPLLVAFYAAGFFLVNATYICLICELVDRAPAISLNWARNVHLLSDCVPEA
jgi:hypothetical protein